MSAVERRLRDRIAELEKAKAGLEWDLDEFRDHFADRFRWWVELLGKGLTPNVGSVIQADAKFLQSVKWWPW